MLLLAGHLHFEMVCEDTLRIKHLPKELSDAEKEDLLRHFGAQKVKTVSNSRNISVTFAQFESKEIAKTVLHRIHQITILDNRLCVEFAEHDIVEDKQKIQDPEKIEKDDGKYFRTFINKLNAFNSSVSFNQPPPNHLKYTYPKPNRATINNIAHALASVPKFYTQVLHLMNKMNLPPPFSDVPDPPRISLRHMPPILTPAAVKSHVVVPTVTKEESSESELESDPETFVKNDIIPLKRTVRQKKVVKRPKFIKPSTRPPTSNVKHTETTETVFEKTDIQSRKIEMKISAHLEQRLSEALSTDAPRTSEDSTDVQHGDNDKTEKPLIITDEELENNRVQPKDFGVLPVFKNYHPGAPTSRLYIKNIAKTVEVKDMEYIYKRYCGNSNDPDKVSEFHIKLMQERRMKGQAFITLDSVELATKAVKETNGFILKNKPLVVVFAKSAATKK